MKVHAGTIPARCGIEPGGRTQNGREQQHDGRQSVHDCDNAEWRRPVAQQIDAYAIGPIAGNIARREAEQDNGKYKLNDDGAGAQRQPDFAPRVADQQHGSTHHEWHGNRENWRMMHPAVHERFSRPSTWSVPDSPREASSTTRNRAVVAKPITMAVSTSA